MKTITADIQSDYTAQLQVGTQIYSASGFLIGVIVDVVDQPEFIGDGAVYTPPTDDRDYRARTI